MVAITNTLQSSLSLDIASGLNHFAANLENAANSVKTKIAYVRTVKELNSLSNRELEDIGIIRGDIKRIARKSV